MRGTHQNWAFTKDISREDSDLVHESLTESVVGWTSHHSYFGELPFSLVGVPNFPKYVVGLCPKFKFVTKIPWEVIVSSFMRLKIYFKRVYINWKPRVCLTTYTWTSSNHVPFMEITAYSIDTEWRFHRKY